MRKPIKNKRGVKKDPKYDSVRIERMINYIMTDGKKTIAREIVYKAFDEIKKMTKRDDPLQIFEEALQNVGPLMELRSRRVGGANYQIPREVSQDRRLILGFRWIIQSAKSKKGSPMYIRLAKELVDASNNEGEAVAKRENTHKMAESNRAFAHLTW